MTTSPRYTRELLSEAAAQCKDLDEVIARYGIRPHPRLKQYLMRRFSAYGIDVSHLKTRPYVRHEKPDEATLSQVVATSRSLSETLRVLGRPSGFGWTASLKKWISEAGLDTSHFLGQAHQRGKPNAAARRAAEDVLVRHDGKRRTGTKVLRRALRDIGVPDECGRCASPAEWNGLPMTLEIDHVNGDWSDDRRENLRLLCPNCHAITSTWCRGGRRKPPC